MPRLIMIVRSNFGSLTLGQAISYSRRQGFLCLLTMPSRAAKAAKKKASASGAGSAAAPTAEAVPRETNLGA